MAFTPRKAEVQAVMEAIESADSLEAVAKAALKEAWNCIQARELYVVAVKEGRALYGPFASENDAYGALKKNTFMALKDPDEIKRAKEEGFVPTLGGEAAVLTTRSPLAAGKALAEIDDEAEASRSHTCATCKHPDAVHDWPKRRSGCAIKWCNCKTFERES